MLRKIRLTLAVLCFATVTLLFLDFTGTLRTETIKYGVSIGVLASPMATNGNLQYFVEEFIQLIVPLNSSKYRFSITLITYLHKHL